MKVYVPEFMDQDLLDDIDQLDRMDQEETNQSFPETIDVEELQF